jgi:hypothetical protein
VGHTFAFVVIATKDQPWQRVLQKGPLSTWAKKLNSNERLLAAYSDGALGDSRQDPENHQKLIFEKPKELDWEISEPRLFEENHGSFLAHSGYGGLIPTTISAISYLQSQYDPDFIIRTNVSSYWNLVALRKLLGELPPTGVYAGVTGEAFSGLAGLVKSAKYVSGAGMILSRDVCKKMVSERKKFDLTCIDDLSIGRTFAGMKIKSTELSRIDFRHVWDINQLPLNTLKENVHFRCKSVHRVGNLEIRRDVSLMRHLHSVIERLDE